MHKRTVVFLCPYIIGWMQAGIKKEDFYNCSKLRYSGGEYG